MKRTGVVVGTLLCLMLIGKVSSAHDRGINAWIPFDEVRSPDGSLDLVHLEAAAGEEIRRRLPPRVEKEVSASQRSDRAGQCDVQMVPQFEPEVPPGATFEEAVGKAHAVVRGVIVATEGGFFHGTPGTMLEIAATEFAKVPAESRPEDPLRFFYPWAELELEGRKICVRGYHQGLAPSVGQDVLLVLVNAPLTSAGHRKAPMGRLLEEEIVFATRPGRPVSVPERYRADPHLSPRMEMDELSEWVASKASGCTDCSDP